MGTQGQTLASPLERTTAPSPDPRRDGHVAGSTKYRPVAAIIGHWPKDTRRKQNPNSARQRGSRSPRSPGGRRRQWRHHPHSLGACLLLAPSRFWKLRASQEHEQNDLKQGPKVQARSRGSRNTSRKEQTTFWGQKSLCHLRVGISPVTGKAVGAGSRPFSVQGPGTRPARPHSRTS